MTTVLVTGGTGTLGKSLVPGLIGEGHDVRVLTRRPDPDLPTTRVTVHHGDLSTGTGLSAAVAGVDTVVHAASAPFRDVVATDVEGTERLVRAAAGAGVGHLLYVSIVGVDRIPYRYYWAKLAAELAVASGRVPWTIQRATQFHELVAYALARVRSLPVMPLPSHWSCQPVAAAEVGDRLVELVGAGPQGRAPDFGGPEIRPVTQLARSYMDLTGLSRRTVSLPVPGRVGAAFKDGYHLCPDHAQGKETWEAWLARTLA